MRIVGEGAGTSLGGGEKSSTKMFGNWRPRLYPLSVLYGGDNFFFVLRKFASVTWSMVPFS